MGSDLSVGVVVGLTAEARIAQRTGWCVAVGGGTSAGAEAAAQRLIDQRVSGLISFGLAGGLDPVLRPGEIIVPSIVIAGEVRHPTDPDLSQIVGGGTGHVLLGADTIAASLADKRHLRDVTAAAAVDLESGAVARVAAARGVPFAVLRAICDPAERALPTAALHALNAHGAIMVWHVLAELIFHPRQLSTLLALAADAAKARRALVARIRRLAQQQQVVSLP